MAIHRNLINVLGLLVCLALVNNPAIVAGQDLPKEFGLFPFGDSYYDVGNKLNLTKYPPIFFWPYGMSVDNPSGRYSDGDIVPDFIAKFLEIPGGRVPPILQQDADLSRGASFAVGDASVLEPAAQDTMTLNQQVVKFREKSSNWDKEFLSQSLFLFYIGAEDYLTFTKSNPNATASAQQDVVTRVNNQLRNDIQLLYLLGARKFAVQLLAPLGCLPIVRQEYKKKDECYEQLNDLAKQHNDKIRSMLPDLAKQNPGFEYNYFEFYDAIMHRITRNLNFRFAKTNVSCCGIGTHSAFGCGKPNVHSNLCDYQRSYLFFDGQHNSEKANQGFAHLFFAGDTKVVYPKNLRDLLVGNPKLSMLKR